MSLKKEGSSLTTPNGTIKKVQFQLPPTVPDISSSETSSSGSEPSSSEESDDLRVLELQTIPRFIPRPKIRRKYRSNAQQSFLNSEHITGARRFFSLPPPRKTSSGGSRRIATFKERIYDIPRSVIPESHKMMLELLKTGSSSVVRLLRYFLFLGFSEICFVLLSFMTSILILCAACITLVYMTPGI